MPSITGVPECLKLRKRCRIRARIHRKLLRDDADLPPWFLAISTPMESNESIRACATPGPLAPHLTRPPVPAAENPARRPPLNGAAPPPAPAPSGSRHKHSEGLHNL